MSCLWAERHSSFEFEEAWFKNCLIYFIVFTGNSYKIWFNWSAFNFYCFWIFDRVLNWWGICKLELHCAFLCSCYYSCITNTVSVLLVIVILMTQNLLLWAWIFSTSLFIWPSLCQLSQLENGREWYLLLWSWNIHKGYTLEIKVYFSNQALFIFPHSPFCKVSAT